MDSVLYPIFLIVPTGFNVILQSDGFAENKKLKIKNSI